jgi:hypothetical protein
VQANSSEEIGGELDDGVVAAQNGFADVLEQALKKDGVFRQRQVCIRPNALLQL